MDAKEFLKKLGINNRVINSDDLSEYWKRPSDLMEEYHQSKVNNGVLDDVINTPIPCSCCGKFSCSGGCL